MGISASNEMGPDGRETNFRRDVRQALDMHPMDRDERIIEEVKRLKKLAETQPTPTVAGASER